METHNSNQKKCATLANVTNDREAYQKFWIAALTRPKSEKKVAQKLSADNHCRPSIETYLPLQTIIRHWSDRKKKIDVPVIPMVVFARVSQEEVLIVNSEPLIIKIMTQPGQRVPAIIPDEQIDRLKFMLEESENPIEFEPIVFKTSDKVKVVRGNLKGLEGQVVRTSEGKTKLVISIDFLGGASVEINPNNIQLI